MTKINPNLIKLAELTHNPDLKTDKTILEKRINENINVPNLKGYIYVHSIKLYVAKERISTRNNWYETHEELHKKGLQMLTIPEFIEFIKYLKDGYKDRKEAEQILDEILTIRSPQRAEWLDADFKVINEKLHINYNHRTINGELKPRNSEPLEDCLMEAKTPGIDLEYWLNHPTKQGLPGKYTLNGNLYYRCPMKDNNSVAGLYVDSAGTALSCCWYTKELGPSLRVRAAKTRELK